MEARQTVKSDLQTLKSAEIQYHKEFGEKMFIK